MTAGLLRALHASTAVFLAGLVFVWLATGSSLSGFSSTLTNSGSTIGTGTLLYSHAYPEASAATGSCTSTPLNAVQAVNCDKSIYPARTGTTATPSAVTDKITANGTVPSSAITQTVSLPMCGPVQLADATNSNADPQLARGNAIFQQIGPFPTDTQDGSIGLDGSTASSADVTTTNTSTVLGSSWSIGAWFRVPAGNTAGGVVMGLADDPGTSAPVNYAPVLWIDKTGRINVGVAGTLGSSTATSASTYNDGSWHLVVATMSGLTLTLYVDGTSTSKSVLSALTGYNGYWHLGWDRLNPQWDPTASPYFTGSLSNAFVVGNNLSSANVQTLRNVTTQAAWDSTIAGFGAVHSWRLNDTGKTVYTGSKPVIASTSPCSYVDLSLSATTPSTTVVKTMTPPVSTSVSVPAPGTTQTLSIALNRNSSFTGTSVQNYLTGLLIYAPITFTYAVTTSTSWYTTFTWANAQTPSTATSAFVI